MSDWIVPCNAKKFDIFKHLQTNNEIAFKRVGALRKDDIAYIYLSSPYSEVKFRCTVINDQMSTEELDDHPYVVDKFSANRYVLIRVDEEYEHGSLPLAKLKENGLGQVQRQARADGKLLNYNKDNGQVKGA